MTCRTATGHLVRTAAHRLSANGRFNRSQLDLEKFSNATVAD
jgi:hypothetical protein